MPQTVLIQKECINYENRYQKNGQWPILTEKTCLNIQALL